MHAQAEHITSLLNEVREGNRASADQLLEAVYADLWGIARRSMAAERRAPSGPSSGGPAGGTEPTAPAAYPAPPESPANREALEQVRSRLIQVGATAKTAEDMFNGLRQSAQRLGQSLHPNTTEAYHRMQGALGEAQRNLDMGRADAAREQLDIAEAFAN